MLGGGGLLAVFPLAYATILPALYPTIIAMLLSLVFRGVAFEFRFRARRATSRAWWDRAFMRRLRSWRLLPGPDAGRAAARIKVQDRAYAGGWWDWLTGFTVLCGVALVVGYALQGACWLNWRTEGPLQRRCRRYANVLGIALLVLIVAVSVWTPMLTRRSPRAGSAIRVWP